MKENATRVLEPEVMPPALEAETREELALAQRLEDSFISRMEQIENAEAIFERRAKLLETAHLIAIRRTRPEDWVLFRGTDGGVTAMLTASGADLMADVFGIEIKNIRPLDNRGVFAPEKLEVPGKSGVYTLRAWCDARSNITGRKVESLEAGRRSDEKFVGRNVDADQKFVARDGVALESDLRAAVQTLLRTKAVRVLCGMTRVPVSDLERAWNGTAKKVADCRKGSGYGSGSERKSTDGADAATVGEAEALWKEMLRRVGGDESAALQLLREITAYPAKEGSYKAFAGCTSWQQLNTPDRVAKAKRNLAKHAQFGDGAGREPGED